MQTHHFLHAVFMSRYSYIDIRSLLRQLKLFLITTNPGLVTLPYFLCSNFLLYLRTFSFLSFFLQSTWSSKRLHLLWRTSHPVFFPHRSVQLIMPTKALYLAVLIIKLHNIFKVTSYICPHHLAFWSCPPMCYNPFIPTVNSKGSIYML